MKQQQSQYKYREPLFFLDPFHLSTKVNLRRKTIALLYLTGLGLTLAGILLLLRWPQALFLSDAGAGIAFIGALLYMVAWLSAITNAIKAGRLGWFFFLILISIPVLLAYSLFGPDLPRTMSDSEFFNTMHSSEHGRNKRQ